MNRIRATLVAAALASTVFAAPAAFAAFRCGPHLVEKGDHDFLVQKHCGEPAKRDVVGYTLTPEGERELKVERWVYGPKNGVYQVLTFKGGVLESLEMVRE